MAAYSNVHEKGITVNFHTENLMSGSTYYSTSVMPGSNVARSLN